MACSGAYEEVTPQILTGAFYSGNIMAASGLTTIPSESALTFRSPRPEPDVTQVFLLELLSRPEEMGMLSALWADPDDVSARAQYVDYLLDRDRVASAERVRQGFTPALGYHKSWPLAGPVPGVAR